MTNSRFDFKITKLEVKQEFTKIPNVLINDLMHYLTITELRLVLYIYQKDNDFKYNRKRIAEKFIANKKNLDKVFSSLEQKRILVFHNGNYVLNLHIDTSEFKIDLIEKSSEKRKIYHENLKNKPASSKTSGGVNHTSHEVKNTSPISRSEVNNTSLTEVKHTSPSNLAITSIDETYSNNKSSNKTNINKTNKDNIDRDNYLNINNIGNSNNSIIENKQIENLTPNSTSNKIAPSEENEIINTSNSIPFLLLTNLRLEERFRDTSCNPEDMSIYSDRYIAHLIIAYLKRNNQWDDIYQTLKNKKHLGGLLMACKSALELQLFEDIKNNLAEEIILQSKLSKEELEKLFFGFVRE